MARRADVKVCPMDGILRILSGPWTTYILWCLRNDGRLRFSGLKASIPTISSKVLTERLRMLEGAGLVHRDYEPTIPPTVTYSLTTRGEELKDVLDGLAVVGMRWQAEDAILARPARHLQSAAPGRITSRARAPGAGL